MVKEYTYLVAYQATLYTGAVIVSNTLFAMKANEYFEDDEFYSTAYTCAEGDARQKYPNNVSNIVVLNVVNLTKLKPIMEV